MEEVSVAYQLSERCTSRKQFASSNRSFKNQARPLDAIGVLSTLESGEVTPHANEECDLNSTAGEIIGARSHTVQRVAEDFVGTQLGGNDNFC